MEFEVIGTIGLSDFQEYVKAENIREAFRKFCESFLGVSETFEDFEDFKDFVFEYSDGDISITGFKNS